MTALRAVWVEAARAGPRWQAGSCLPYFTEVRYHWPLRPLPLQDDEGDAMSDPYFVLNRNDGQDTVHRNPREECNVDDVEGRQTIDAETADALMASGEARPCQHCIESAQPEA